MKTKAPIQQPPSAVEFSRQTGSYATQKGEIVLVASVPGIGVTVGKGDVGIIKTGVRVKLERTALIINPGDTAYRGVFPVGWFIAENELCVLMHNGSNYSKTFYSGDLLGVGVLVKTEKLQ